MFNKNNNMRLHLFFVILIFSVACTSCHATNKSDSTNCRKFYNEANKKLNEYYQYADLKNLDTALSTIDANISNCSEYEAKMVNLKIRLLILLKSYDRGYKFIDSLDEAKFDKLYKKKFYLKTFKIMELENNGDSASIKEQYKEIVSDISRYLIKHPSDKEAIADLFFTRAKVESKSDILKDLEIMRKKDKSIDSNFFSALETAIFENDAESSAIPND